MELGIVYRRRNSLPADNVTKIVLLSIDDRGARYKIVASWNENLVGSEHTVDRRVFDDADWCAA